MDFWTNVLPLIGTFCCTGGFLYLIIDKKVLSKREKVEVSSDVIGNGVKVLDIYKEIDQIVEDKVTKATKPLEEKIDGLTNMLNQFGCGRAKDCNDKLPCHLMNEEML